MAILGDVAVLGPLEVDGPDGAVSVGGPAPRRILTTLILRAGAVCRVDTLIAAAWGDSPPTSAERTLASHMTRLREALALADGISGTQIEHADGGYRLRVAPDGVDVARFERAVEAAAGLSPAAAVLALREALALWRSHTPFADLQDTEYPSGDAATLVELRGSAIESLAVASKVGEICPACGVPAKMFEPYDDKVSEARRRMIDLHIHPVIVHSPRPSPWPC